MEKGETDPPGSGGQDAGEELRRDGDYVLEGKEGVHGGVREPVGV